MGPGLSAADELREELVLLRAALARRLREQLQAEGPVQPAMLEAVRKFLSDQGMVLGKEPKPAPAPAISRDLPFSDEDTE